MCQYKNIDKEKKEFEIFLGKAIDVLEKSVAKRDSILSDLAGRNFEPYFYNILVEIAKGSTFENTIELIGGQRFPDIIVNKKFGIEIKTTTQRHWRTTGNSVKESTRVEGVDFIYLLFAQISFPFSVKFRRYEDVLADIVVTHSPRYMIDMNLKDGETIFNKIEVEYNILRNQENPIKPIVDYYKSKLVEGEELWWIDNENISSNLVIKLWNNIDIAKREEIKNRAMIYFPELFSNSINKFSRFAIWLTTRESIVCPNIRDLFTAGGQSELEINNNKYQRVPRILINLFANAKTIKNEILNTPKEILNEFWGIETTDENKITDWIEIISKNSNNIISSDFLNVKKVLYSLISESSSRTS